MLPLACGAQGGPVQAPGAVLTREELALTSGHSAVGRPRPLRQATTGRGQRSSARARRPWGPPAHARRLPSVLRPAGGRRQPPHVTVGVASTDVRGSPPHGGGSEVAALGTGSQPGPLGPCCAPPALQGAPQHSAYPQGPFRWAGSRGPPRSRRPVLPAQQQRTGQARGVAGGLGRGSEGLAHSHRGPGPWWAPRK